MITCTSPRLSGIASCTRLNQQYYLHACFDDADARGGDNTALYDYAHSVQVLSRYNYKQMQPSEAASAAVDVAKSTRLYTPQQQRVRDHMRCRGSKATYDCALKHSVAHQC
jgi:hypothetical protein